MKSYAAMNEGMLGIKRWNWILSLLFMLILVSWSRFHIAVHSAVDAQEMLSTAAACNF